MSPTYKEEIMRILKAAALSCAVFVIVALISIWLGFVVWQGGALVTSLFAFVAVMRVNKRR